MQSLIDFLAEVTAPKTTSDVVIATILLLVGLLSMVHLINSELRKQWTKRAKLQKERLFDLDTDEVPDTAAALRRFEGQFNEDPDAAI